MKARQPQKKKGKRKRRDLKIPLAELEPIPDVGDGIDLIRTRPSSKGSKFPKTTRIAPPEEDNSEIDDDYTRGYDENAFEDDEGQMQEEAGEAGEAAEEPEEPAETWLPLPVETAPIRTLLDPDNVMGIAEPPTKCFGCCYQSVGSAKGQTHVLMSDQQWLDLTKMMGEYMSGGMPIDTAAIQVSNYYRLLRDQCNAQRQPGEIPLPDWNPATIVEHIVSHMNDEGVWAIERLEETKLMSRMILKSLAFVQNQQTGEVRMESAAITAYEKLFKMQVHLQKHLRAAKDDSDSILSLSSLHTKIKTQGRAMFRKQGARPRAYGD